MSNAFASLFLVLALTQAQTFPLDKELRSSLSGDSANVSTVIKVSKAGDVYTYLYSIKNNGNVRVLVKWNVIDKACYYGHDLETIWEVPPHESINVVLEHVDPPVEVHG